MNATHRTPSPAVLHLTGFLALALLAPGCTEEGDTIVTNPSEPGGGDPPPPGIDTDGDGLTDLEEFNGWNIAVDFTGFGEASVQHLTVKSNPMLSDSDGDGLADLDEFQLRLDPRSGDSDLDGLSDSDEVFVWLSNAASVDTDADARGSGGNAPNARLFDGNETRMFCDGNDPGGVCVHLGTSPTLADTDGDGLSDYAEFDDASRSPLISDLPRIDMEVAGEVDMRLNVEYEESLGQSKEYGSTFSSSETTISRNTTNWSNTLGASIQSAFEVGAEGTAALAGADTKLSLKTSVTLGVHYDFAWGGGDETGTDTTEETSTSQLQSDERTMTESAASGTISLGLVVRNSGSFAVAIEDLGVTVLRYETAEPDLAGPESFKVLATLSPEFPGLTIGPGEDSAPIQVSSSDVNVDVLKEFLASPSGLVFSPIASRMTAQNGIDFDFLTEKTFTQTALVEIDLGGDEDVEAHRIATNVRRGPGGTYLGITMREVLTELLQIPYETDVLVDADGVPTGRRILTKLAGRENSAIAPGQLPEFLWLVQVARDGSAPAPDVSDFEEIRLQAGDEIRLIAWIDSDQDGLSTTIEDFVGSSDGADEVADPEDTDADGLTDPEEALEGWLAGWPNGVDPEDGTEPTLSSFGYPKPVVSDPRVVDTDEDGLTDLEEKNAGTDPTQVDTDRDGLQDGRDPYPLLPARVLRVDADNTGSMGPGLAADWSNAFERLQDAIASANSLNGNPDGDDDVGEIWVADGTYRPDQGAGQTMDDRAATFTLPHGLGVFGGFAGGETKRGQRTQDPFTNGTVLSGDLLADDESIFSEDGLDTDDNSFHVVTIPALVAIPGQNPSDPVLDGFLITGGNADGSNTGGNVGGGVLVNGEATPELGNLFFRTNQAVLHGGALSIENARSNPSSAGARLKDCIFDLNRTTDSSAGRGGAVYVSAEKVALLNCRFSENSCDTVSELLDGLAPSMGGGLCFFGGSATLTNCSFFGNQAQWGGGAFLDRGVVRECVFERNKTHPEVLALPLLNDVQQGSALMTGVPFFFLHSIVDHPVDLFGSTVVVQCIFWANQSVGVNGQAFGALAGGIDTHVRSCTFFDNDGRAIRTAGTVENSILWQNTTLEYSEVQSFRYCCVRNGAPGTNNIREDPKIVNGPDGNLRIGLDSPCIDTGNSLADFDPIAPGFQRAPLRDLDGRFRIVGGGIDMGAFEFQGN